MDVVYVARPGGIRVSGHTAGTTYTITGVEAQACDPTERVVEDVAVTLSGAAESVVDRVDTMWSISTTILEATEWDMWRELFASAGRGDVVVVYPGAIFGPIAVGSIIGYIERHSLTRHGLAGHFAASFVLREPG